MFRFRFVGLSCSRLFFAPCLLTLLTGATKLACGQETLPGLPSDSLPAPTPEPSPLDTPATPNEPAKNPPPRQDPTPAQNDRCLYAMRNSRLRFTLDGPSPVFQQSRNNRPNRSNLQFPVTVDYTLRPRSPLGRLFLASENVISTDAYDTSSRLGLRIGFERPLYPGGPRLLGDIRSTMNQEGSNKTLGAGVGTLFPLPFTTGSGRPELQVNFLEYENRQRRDLELSPYHAARHALLTSVGLRLSPVCLGEGPPTRRPHFTLGASAWYFLNEEGAFGAAPRNFEYRYEAGFVVPARSLPFRMPFVQALAFTYFAGANDGAGYARQSNFRFHFILRRSQQVMEELQERGLLREIPRLTPSNFLRWRKSDPPPILRNKEGGKQSEQIDAVSRMEKTESSVNSSTFTENGGN